MSLHTVQRLQTQGSKGNILLLGNGAVVRDRSDYDQVILKIIIDTSEFRPIKEDPSLIRDGRLQHLLRKLKKDGCLDNVVYENIYPKGSQPARVYGLPKLFEFKARGPNSTPPFRPIVCSIGTYNYSSTKYFCNLLSPHIPTEQCATDTSTFVQESNLYLCLVNSWSRLMLMFKGYVS